MKTDTIKFVEFGRGGDVAHVSARRRLSGHGNPERPHAAKVKEGLTIPDGTLALDKRPAIDTKEGFAWVFKGPLVNVDLENDDIDRCPEPSQWFADAIADNAYGKMLMLHKAFSDENTAGPLDQVSIVRYVAGWVARGAKVGVYKDGEIKWSSEK